MVSRIGLGCWPLAGISSLEVNDADSLATIRSALEHGINFIDTAYSYGYHGESDRLIARALECFGGKAIVATKVGTHYDASGNRNIDGRPETLIDHARQSLDRLGLQQLDLLYLHCPDPQVPLAESADAIAELIGLGLVKHAGVSNVDLPQLQTFHQRCPVVVVQPHFNMIQQDAVASVRQFCLEQEIGIACYWVLMKGLLAGRMARDHQFDPADRRLTYAIYQGKQWNQAQDLLDGLREIANRLDCTVSQLVVAWTLRQQGISVALLGAKRSQQIEETSGASDIELTDELLQRINRLVDSQGGT